MTDRRARNDGKTTAIARIRAWQAKVSGLFAFALLAAVGAIHQLLASLALYGETTTQLLFDFTNDPWGAILFVVGLLGIVLLGLGLALHWVKGSPRHIAGGFVVLFVLMFVGFLVASGITPSTGNVTAAPANATLQGYIVAPTETGCSVNTITFTETCTAVYNYTSNYFAVSTTNASTCNWYSAACHPRNYIDLSVHEARTDAINRTYGFAFAIGSIPTVTTTSTSYPVESPVVGFIPATSTASGYWLVKQNAGSLNAQNPTETAPGTVSNLGSSTVGIQSFGSVTDLWNVTMPGAGGSPAPATLYSAVTIYGSYSMTFTVGNASPATYTLTVIVIGEHA